MKEYKISIIVPVYNIDRYLQRCLDSLAAQTYPDLEIILVDDGSRDRSGFICDSFGGLHENVRVIHKENGGLISAWTAGVRVASGNYVSFVDGDDWIEPNMMEEMSGYLTGSDREVICSDYIIERIIRKGRTKTRESEYVYQSMEPGDYDRKAVREKIIPELMGNEHRSVTVSRCMKLIGTGLITENLKYCDPRIRMGEDAMIILPVLMDAEHIRIMDHKAYYHYEVVGSSMVHKYDREAFENALLLYQNLGRMLEDKFGTDPGMLERLKKRLDMEFVVLLFLVLKNEARNPAPEYREKIMEICTDERVSRVVKEAPVTVTDRSNKLLYGVLKSPSFITISMLRSAMKVNDAKY